MNAKLHKHHGFSVCEARVYLSTARDYLVSVSASFIEGMLPLQMSTCQCHDRTTGKKYPGKYLLNDLAKDAVIGEVRVSRHCALTSDSSRKQDTWQRY